MKTKWTLLDVPVDSIQAFGCRSARLSGKPSRHNYKLDSSARGLRVLSPRAAATLTPASVVTSRPQIRDGEHLEARLGPLGRSLVQQVEVTSRPCRFAQSLFSLYLLLRALNVRADDNKEVLPQNLRSG